MNKRVWFSALMLSAAGGILPMSALAAETDLPAEETEWKDVSKSQDLETETEEGCLECTQTEQTSVSNEPKTEVLACIQSTDESSSSVKENEPSFTDEAAIDETTNSTQTSTLTTTDQEDLTRTDAADSDLQQDMPEAAQSDLEVYTAKETAMVLEMEPETQNEPAADQPQQETSQELASLNEQAASALEEYESLQSLQEEQNSQQEALLDELADNLAQVEVLEESLKQAQSDLEAAQQQAQKAEEDWKQATENLAQAQEDSQAYQDSVEKARQDLADAQAQADRLAAQVQAQQNTILADLQKAYEDACSQYALGTLGFFQSLANGQDADAAMAVKILQDTTGYTQDRSGSSNIAGYTHLGEANDATCLENVLPVFDWIRECNALRAANGLSILKISSSLMAVAEKNANYSAQNNAHSKAYNVGENLAFGYTDPFKGWYDEEKVLYDKGIESGTGHYKNIVNSTYAVTGFAYVPQGKTYKTIYGQTFQLSGSVYAKTQWTVDSYEQAFLNYYNQVVSAKENAASALQKAKADPSSIATSYDSAWKNAAAAVTAKQSALNDLLANPVQDQDTAELEALVEEAYQTSLQSTKAKEEQEVVWNQISESLYESQMSAESLSEQVTVLGNQSKVTAAQKDQAYLTWTSLLKQIDELQAAAATQNSTTKRNEEPAGDVTDNAQETLDVSELLNEEDFTEEQNQDWQSQEENSSEETQDQPTQEEKTPEETQDQPAQEEKTPEETQDQPAQEEKTPEESQDEPAQEEKTPEETQDQPAQEEKTPEETQDQPVQDEVIQTVQAMEVEQLPIPTVAEEMEQAPVVQPAAASMVDSQAAEQEQVESKAIIQLEENAGVKSELSIKEELTETNLTDANPSAKPYLSKAVEDFEVHMKKEQMDAQAEAIKKEWEEQTGISAPVRYEAKTSAETQTDSTVQTQTQPKADPSIQQEQQTQTQQEKAKTLPQTSNSKKAADSSKQNGSLAAMMITVGALLAGLSGWILARFFSLFRKADQ